MRNHRMVALLLGILLSVREVWGSISGPVKSVVAYGSPPLRRFFGAV